MNESGVHRRGVRVTCAVCGNTKRPIGRSAPMGALYCDEDCAGYRQQPYVGSLWPGETMEDFGYSVSAHGTELVLTGRPQSVTVYRGTLRGAHDWLEEWQILHG